MQVQKAQDETRHHERTIAGLQAEKAMITEAESRTSQVPCCVHPTGLALVLRAAPTVLRRAAPADCH